MPNLSDYHYYPFYISPNDSCLIYLQLWEEELERKILIVGMPEFAWSKYRVELQGTCDAVERRAKQMERRESSLVVHRASAS